MPRVLDAADFNLNEKGWKLSQMPDGALGRRERSEENIPEEVYQDLLGHDHTMGCTMHSRRARASKRHPITSPPTGTSNPDPALGDRPHTKAVQESTRHAQTCRPHFSANSAKIISKGRSTALVHLTIKIQQQIMYKVPQKSKNRRNFRRLVSFHTDLYVS